MTVKIDRPVLRYFGSKWRLAPWIIKHFPPHKVYVEAFGGGAAVLLRKRRSRVEVYNDLDSEVVNFFSVLRDPILASALASLVRLTPYSREEFNQSFEPTDDPIEKARRLVIRAYMGFGSNACVRRNKTGFRANDWTARKSNSRIWEGTPDAIVRSAERFTGVVIENRPALDLLDQQDGEETVFYLDPPYLPETRTSYKEGKGYRHEMTEQDHIDLALAAQRAKGYVLVSGYHSELYDSLYAGWTCETKKACTQGNADNIHRTECLWLSPRTADRLSEGRLF